MPKNQNFSAYLPAYRRKVRLLRYYFIKKMAKSWIYQTRKDTTRIMLWPPFDPLQDREAMHEVQQYIMHYLGSLQVQVVFYMRQEELLLCRTFDTFGNSGGDQELVDPSAVERSRQLARYCLVWRISGKIRFISLRPQYYYVGKQEGHFFTNEWLRLTADMYRSQRTLPTRKVHMATFPVETCAVLGTGPSLSDFVNESEQWDTWIGANFLVCDEIIRRLGRPFALCLADSKLFSPLPSVQPLWKCVFEFLRETPATLITTLDFAAYIELHFPEDIKKKCKFVKTLGHDTPNPMTAFDIHNMHITPYGNVLTDLMLPVATSVSKTITLYGCDGIPPGENGNFPKYSSLKSYDEAQLKELEGTISQKWYSAYFDQHEQYTRYVVNECQKAGAKLSLRRPSWNKGLCDIPVLEDEFQGGLR